MNWIKRVVSIFKICFKIHFHSLFTSFFFILDKIKYQKSKEKQNQRKGNILITFDTIISLNF